MNLISFSKNLKDPRNTSLEQISGLKNILEDYPYFQAAHFLYLNGLKKQNSFKYNNYLKKTAAYTTDRSVLFDFITSYKFRFKKDNISKQASDKEAKKADAKEIKTIGTPIKEEEEVITNSNLIPGTPLKFDKTESYSFSEWLQIGKIKPIQRNETFDTSKKLKTGKFDLIDDFIIKNPKITPLISVANHNIAMDSITENKNLMTETLAHVYLEQKKYQKAITAFTVLSLKYPEKSGFFANQIKVIQELQEK